MRDPNGYVVELTASTGVRQEIMDPSRSCSGGQSRQWQGEAPIKISLWAGPIERDVLARIRYPLEFEPERINGADRRLAPGHNLSGAGF
jgi:hypothetical protein